MARVKSEEKRSTILAAATQVFASKGLSASTASITSAAGLAEGTLFVYFKGKDELINTLYEEVKQDLADAMLEDLPAKGTLLAQVRHVWNRYVEWGVQNPDQLEVMHKIKLWEGLRPEVRDATAARFAQFHLLIERAIQEGAFRNVPYDFVMAMLLAQAETTMQFIRRNPNEAANYKKKGFEIFWSGVSQS